MQESHQRLLEQAKAAPDDFSREAAILSSKPDWQSLENAGQIPKGSAQWLNQIHGTSSSAVVTLAQRNEEVISGLLSVLKSVEDMHAVQYAFTVIYEATRYDSSFWNLLVGFARKNDIMLPFTRFLSSDRAAEDSYSSDKALYVLTNIMSHDGGRRFNPQEAKMIADSVADDKNMKFKGVSDLGRLDGFCNLLKFDGFRAVVWNNRKVQRCIMNAISGVESSDPLVLYRGVFCVWCVSFNKELVSTSVADMGDDLVQALLSVVANCRVEKVIRMTLAVLSNFLGDDKMCTAIVESGIIHYVQNLEYEKWRDQELYEDVRKVAAMIASEISTHTNFERYERELRTNKLRWGFIHSEKFWLENAEKFDREQFAAVKALVALLKSDSADDTTKAVACHDIGEFARVYPTGKQVLNRLSAKPAVMALMTSKDRDVAREALLATQKLMLNKWQALQQGAL
ncbi:vacuolar ATP synthase subunit h, putative [Perkinsus marinus ATCC 50983]|uniref:V-type proton ATPase subunit H n=1 Tax=Perkinsus marinus (strain ATCC 50983 / TXsc) TaxID=423536 RepID=C5KB62_PERM5|nr:vacuolar ATP synthase subunit h, putative [Perkinsus marinus ATCC 50983]EER18388.1 vacuolar ATP synthase subunit h, putative [Perkinsus marinus ATCC 50983]|eukprot:XP_002786592.1 vacuolar ATP synthase subunit h, putative [Perkinsus marinus ATCC 50983]